MRCTIPLIPCVALLLAAPLSAQSQDGHVYNVLWFAAHTGDEAEYSRSYREILRPVFDYLVEQGAIVSYLDLVKNTGSASSTHMVLVEFPNWTAFGEYPEKLDQASMVVFRRPFAEVAAERFTPFREPRGSEIYTATPGN